MSTLPPEFDAQGRESCCPDEETYSPWICHICNFQARTPSRVCGLCYMTTCTTHLQTLSRFNPETGLYELLPVCLSCATLGPP